MKTLKSSENCQSTKFETNQIMDWIKEKSEKINKCNEKLMNYEHGKEACEMIFIKRDTITDCDEMIHIYLLLAFIHGSTVQLTY